MKLRDFWDGVHRDGFDLWLSDTPPDSYIRHLGLDLSSPSKVLEVGVGRGLMVKYLLGEGHEVTGCDISSVALGALPEESGTVLVEDLPELDDRSHDIGISYLTIQHMDPGMVEFVVQQAIRICGVFKFQMAGMIDQDLGIKEYDGPMFMTDPETLAGSMPSIEFKSIGEMPHQSQNIVWTFVEAK